MYYVTCCLQDRGVLHRYCPTIMEQVLTDTFVSSVPGLFGIQSHINSLIDTVKPFTMENLRSSTIIEWFLLSA